MVHRNAKYEHNRHKRKPISLLCSKTQLEILYVPESSNFAEDELHERLKIN